MAASARCERCGAPNAPGERCSCGAATVLSDDVLPLPVAPRPHPSGRVVLSAPGVQPSGGRAVGGRYQVQEQLAAGPTPTFRVRPLAGGGELALRLVRPTDAGRWQRLQRDLRAAQTLTSFHAVAVRDVGVEPDGALFVVTDLPRGETLAGRASRHGGRLAPDEVRALGLQALDALGAAHAAGLLHRDLKPDDLVVEDRPGGPFLTVMGLGLGAALADGAPVSTPGTPVAAVRYMSPERAFGLPCDPRADLYSLATVLYEALTGWHPLGLTDAGLPQAAQRLRQAPVMPVAQAAPGTDPRLCAALERNLARRPEQRDPDAATFRRALEAAGPAPGTTSGLRRR